MRVSSHTKLVNQAIGFTFVLLLGVSSLVYAAKGEGDDKKKKGYVLKFNGFEVKNNYLSPFALMQQGATYRGTISPMQSSQSDPNKNHSIITYQKGNTIYIYPLQQKGVIQKFKTPSRIN